MTAAHSRGRCDCALCTVKAAVHLLETGRPSMALSLLGPLAAQLESSTAPVRGRGGAAPQRPSRSEAPASGSARPGFARTAAELRHHIGVLGAERVAELLGVTPDDLGPILEGRVGIAGTALRGVRRESKAADVPF